MKTKHIKKTTNAASLSTTSNEASSKKIQPRHGEDKDEKVQSHRATDVQKTNANKV